MLKTDKPSPIFKAATMNQNKCTPPYLATTCHLGALVTPPVLQEEPVQFIKTLFILGQQKSSGGEIACYNIQSPGDTSYHTLQFSVSDQTLHEPRYLHTPRYLKRERQQCSNTTEPRAAQASEMALHILPTSCACYWARQRKRQLLSQTIH